MSRAAILATIVTGIFSFSSFSLAASDEELGKLGDKMSGAFRCATYAHLFNDQKEQQRLFQIGLKAGRDLVEGMKSMDETKSYLPGASTDFVVGSMYDSVAAKAYDEIVKYDGDGLPLNKWRQPPDIKTEAELSYRKSNCSLIQ